MSGHAMGRWLVSIFAVASMSVTVAAAQTHQNATLAKHQGRLENPYKNPVFQPVFADPSIIRGKDGYFYAYATEDDWGDGHGNHLVPIIRSKDLVHWKYIRDAFATEPSWHSGWIWAPDIRYRDRKYYLFYAMSTSQGLNPGIGVATSTTPAGPFKDHGKLFTSEEIGVKSSIDPALFVNRGTPYLFFGSFNGIYGVKLSQDLFHTIGRPFQIAGDQFEGSYIIKRGGYYYYFGSEGSCCDGVSSTYHVTVGRSRSLRGPYVNEKGESLMYSDGSLVVAAQSANLPDPFIGPGHNSIIVDGRGEDWLVYHAIEYKNSLLPDGATRRPLMIDPLHWKNGWPYVKGYAPSSTWQNGPYIK